MKYTIQCMGKTGVVEKSTIYSHNHFKWALETIVGRVVHDIKSVENMFQPLTFQAIFDLGGEATVFVIPNGETNGTDGSSNPN